MAIKYTSCVYLFCEDTVLLMYRNIKKNDENHGKWIGIGGKQEEHESIRQCAIREIKEETGYTADTLYENGTIHFCVEDKETECITVFTSEVSYFDLVDCNEGTLKWIPADKVLSLPLWQGDALFLKDILKDKKAQFTYTLHYSKQGNLLDWSKD